MAAEGKGKIEKFNVAFNISKEKTIAAVMQALEKLYEKPFASNKVFLIKRLFNMRMSENNSVVDHPNDFNGVTNQLEYVSINFDDEIRTLLFLCSLPDSSNNLVMTVSNFTVSGMLTLDDVVSSMMNDEIQRKTIGDCISSSTALSVDSRVDDNSKVWYVDSGALIHCTPHMDCFCDYIHGNYGPVTIENGYRCNIVGKGKVEIKLSNRGTLVLNDVRHSPELQKSLISISGLNQNQKTTLWHHRLGHLSERIIRILHSKNALPGMKNIQLDFSEGCVYGKQKTGLVENETGNKIKCLKHDNGGEYRDGGFQKYCSNNDIRLIRTVKRTPQENGLAERMNRTIMERAMCMMIHVDLPLYFWAAIGDTAIYLINISPMSALNGGIPEEEWSDK
ncbi:hypothetical protein RJ640_031016 [Escallonia rubra]|uniref:Integrase catalytic domain-containing protein n=1 Tax=Escallonia rubra TaxID=112253 RepID=A0AA88QYE5_9ASTE|nr:hypothetical protein RJ640_031016 [Escallonia rubra]